MGDEDSMEARKSRPDIETLSQDADPSDKDSASAALMDASHAGALGASCEALFRSTERALQWAWRLLQLARTGVDSDVLMSAARSGALDFLDRVPPHVRRGVSELVGYSQLWQAVALRLGRPVARSSEELLRELGEDLQLLLRGAQARLGTAAALEHGLLMQVGRLRESCAATASAQTELRAGLESFTIAVSEVMAAASAFRRAWEAAESELSESAAWLGAGDPGFCTWMVEHLSSMLPAWSQAHASARWLQDIGSLGGTP